MTIAKPTPSNAVERFPVDVFSIHRVRTSAEGQDLVTTAVKDLRLKQEVNDFLDGFAKAS